MTAADVIVLGAVVCWGVGCLVATAALLWWVAVKVYGGDDDR